MKVYDFGYLLVEGQFQRVAGRRVAFSSYPGQ
jgi:hypothetical protein